MKISQKGIDLIKSFEGFRGVAYDDLQPHTTLSKNSKIKGTLTIGYGHTSGVKIGDTISKTDAEKLLQKDVSSYAETVEKAVKVTVNQNQFDAMVSLCYNIGKTAFQKSDLVKYLNQKNIEKASHEFTLWIHSGGKVIQGLVNRRAKEKALFDTPVKTSKPKGSTVTYKIKLGDTLSQIAVNHKTNVNEIMKLNKKITNPNKIYDGQVIKIPR